MSNNPYTAVTLSAMRRHPWLRVVLYSLAMALGASLCVVSLMILGGVR